MGAAVGSSRIGGDIVYEVRDATDFQPSGTKPWWTELPAAGRDAWAERATRRQKRDRYVLAFVPSKFRVGIEPDPFALEINLSTQPWQLDEVTATLDQAGEAARARASTEQAHAEQRLAERLAAEVERRAKSGEQPLTRTEAVDVLSGGGVSREAARALLDREADVRWRFVPDPAHRQRVFVVGINQEWPPHGSPGAEPVGSPEFFEGANHAAHAARGPHGLEQSETFGQKDLHGPPKPCGPPRDSPGADNDCAASAADADSGATRDAMDVFPGSRVVAIGQLAAWPPEGGYIPGRVHDARFGLTSPAGPCPACDEREYHRAGDGWTCSTCHPPIDATRPRPCSLAGTS
jgi:hypothetical protein